MKLKERLGGILSAVVVSAALAFMLCLYAPLELFMSGQDEFWFSLDTLVPVLLILFAVIFAVLFLALLVLRLIGKTPYNIGLLLTGAVIFICYIQGNFLVGGIPSLDGTNFDWNAFSAERIKSIAVAVAVIGILIFVLLRFKESILRKTVMFGSAALSVMLAITLTTLMLTTPIVEKKGDLIPTGEGDFTYSEDKNLIVFVIDAVENKRFLEALDKNPEFKEVFSDFTYYEDAAAMYPFTLNAVPSMLTGVWNENETDFREYVKDSFQKAPLFEYLRGNDYKIGLYNDGEIILPYEFEGWFENQLSTSSKFKDPVSAAVTAVKMSAVRYAPWDLKCFGYNLPQHLIDAKYVSAEPIKEENPDFYAAIKDKNPIKLVGDKCARIIHIEGAHVPYQYDKDVNVIEDATYMDNIECTLTICEKYIERLKESGVYDNSVVVILSDHGYDDTVSLDLISRANPTMMVKGIGDKREEMKISETPVAYEDLTTAFPKLLEGEQTEAVFDSYKYPNGRRYLKYFFNEEHHMEEYIIEGKAYDLDSFKPSGKVFEAEDN